MQTRHGLLHCEHGTVEFQVTFRLEQNGCYLEIERGNAAVHLSTLLRPRKTRTLLIPNAGYPLLVCSSRGAHSP